MQTNDGPCEVRIEARAGALTAAWRAGDEGRWQLQLGAGETGFSGRVAVVLPLPASADMPWFFFPGFLLGDGRAQVGVQRWPCVGPERAAERYESPSWDFALDRGAYPLLLARQGERWRGFSWRPHYRIEGASAGPAVWGDGEPQIGCGLTWLEGSGELRLNLPANEAPRRHARCRYDGATTKELVLPSGGSLIVDLRLHDFVGGPGAYADRLHELRDELAAEHPAAPLPPHRELAEAAVHGLLAWHWVEGDPGYFLYTTPYDRSAEFNANNKGTTLGWHFEALGFVGGFPVAFGLLWAAERLGDERARTVALRCLERWCRDGQTDWGFFHTSYHPGPAQSINGSYPNGPEEPFYGSCWLGDRRLLHARTTADASFHLARCLQLLPADHPRRLSWTAALRRSLEAALSVQDASGRFGQRYDHQARRVEQAEGSAGLLWIPAMATALPLFVDDAAFVERLDVALRVAGAGYAADVEQGWIVGAPEDVDRAPTSEDGYNAVMAYAALHRRFGDGRWATLLQQACDWTLAWRKAYNVRFSPNNVMTQADFRSVGGDFASSHNNHLHIYGCNCVADFAYADELAGTSRYRRRADEHVAYAAQLLCRDDGQWNGQRGMCSEQFYTSDWSIWGDWDPGEQHVQKGSFMGVSHVWCVNMILLALEQYERCGALQELQGGTTQGLRP